MYRKAAAGLVLTITVALLATAAVACGGSAAQGEVVATATRQPPTGTPLPTSTTTTEPTVASLADRYDCEEVRGTDYRSLAEREWFLATCVTPTPSPEPIAAAAALTPTGSDPASTPPPAVSGTVTAFGDSVMLGAASQLQAAGVEVTAQVSLQVAGGIEIIRQRQQAGTLGATVVVHFGNNGTFSVAEFDTLMGLLADVPRVVIVNVKVPRAWEDANNAMFAANVGRYGNAALVDWHAAGSAHSEYFWDDGIHLRPEGAQAYAALVLGAF